MAESRERFAEIIMPPVTQTSDAMRIVTWHIKEGATISVGEVILEIETDKAVMDIESTASGVVRKIFFHENESVPINAVLSLVGKADGNVPVDFDPLYRVKKKVKEEGIPSQTSENVVLSPTIVSEKNRFPKGINISPAAKSLVRQMNISMENIKGSGPGGMITRKDITESGLSMPGLSLILKSEKLSSIRQTIAKRTTQSKSVSPHFYLVLEVDMTRLVEYREKKKKQPGGSEISLTDFIIKATAEALKDFHQVNSRLVGDTVYFLKDVNIGLAVALPDGLIVPVIKNAHRKSLEDIAAERVRLVNKAKERRLKVEECQNGSLTISNLGIHNIDTVFPIINQPESCILGIGSLKKKPVVIDEEIVVRSVLNISISADHRIIDGVLGASFLNHIKNLLEKPEKLYEGGKG